jgi:acyl carrier protein
MQDQEFIDDLAAILEVEVDELHGDFILNSDNWNSLAIVSAIVLIDEQYGIAIPGDKLRSCTSLGNLWNLIKEAKDNQ